MSRIFHIIFRKIKTGGAAAPGSTRASAYAEATSIVVFIVPNHSFPDRVEPAGCISINAYLQARSQGEDSL